MARRSWICQREFVMSAQRHRPDAHRVRRRDRVIGSSWSHEPWRNQGDQLLAYAKAGLPERVRRHLARHPAACADVLSSALVIAEVELRLAHTDEDERAYLDTLAALLDAGAPPSALLPDMSDVVADFHARQLRDALPTAVRSVRTRL
jgi:hypothetical protein